MTRSYNQPPERISALDVRDFEIGEGARVADNDLLLSDGVCGNSESNSERRIEYLDGLTANIFSVSIPTIMRSRGQPLPLGDGIWIILALNAGRDGHAVWVGDVIVLDSHAPRDEVESWESLSIFIPRAISDRALGVEQRAQLIEQNAVLGPLRDCLEFVLLNGACVSEPVLWAHYNACVNLLPVALTQAKHVRNLIQTPLLRRLLLYIATTLDRPNLSPSTAAEQLGISNRYVHKAFKDLGITFSAYVLSKRLELVSFDLASSAHTSVPIARLAFRWGFRDLSTFHRAFKRKFGCTPRELRSRSRLMSSIFHFCLFASLAT